MRGLIYTLLLREPVLANHLGGDANSASSLDYVPGALVRGAVIAAYLRNGHSLDANQEARRLFFDGGTRYLHAYPYGDETEANRRALPVPLCWRKRKGDDLENGAEIFDIAQNAWREDEQPQGLDGFCLFSGATAQGVKTARHINVHTQRDAEAGRSTEANGAVYRYEALAAGTRLTGVILTETEADATTLKAYLPTGQLLRLGKARTAGYGLVEVESCEELSAWWQEAPTLDSGNYNDEEDGFEEDDESPEPPAISALPCFTLTLLSETLVRDDEGQLTLDILPELQTRLKQLKAETKLSYTPGRIFRKMEVVGGFNRKWGLPMPQTAALAAGSVFVIEAKPPLELSVLEKIRDAGLGERRAEGFGRFTLNWQPSASPFMWLNVETEDTPQSATEPLALNDTEKTLAGLILRRLLRGDLETALQEAVLKLDVEGTISSSQLSRWRGIIRSATSQAPEKGRARLKRFHESEAQKNSAGWKQMHRARLRKEKDASTTGPSRLTDWIAQVLDSADSPWDWVKPKSLEQTLGKQISASPDEKLRYEFQLRLLDGVLARQAKRQAGKEESYG